MNRQQLKDFDPEISEIISEETRRQEDGLELIASENFVSRAVMAAMGSALTNKYAEGYPEHRYYGGCEVVDKAERLAIERAKKLFGADHANVQPHAGSQANMAAYMSMIVPGDTILSLDLNAGGHLTHGAKVSFSGKFYNVVSYGLDPKTERIDYEQAARLAKEHKPKLIVTGASSYPRIIDFPRFKEIADSVGARFMVDMAHIAGLVATGLHPSPVPYADVVTTTTHKTLRGPRGGMILCKAELAKKVDSAVFPGTQGGPLEHVVAAKAVALKEALQPDFRNYQQRILDNAQAMAEALMSRGIRLCSGGTDNHLVLADLRSLHLTGKAAEVALGLAHITINKNMIPFDPEKPTLTSGIRIGTPALTTRGFGTDDMKAVANCIVDVLEHPDDEAVRASVQGRVKELCAAHPLYA